MLLTMVAGTRAFAAGDYIAANHTRDNGHPYYIMVNRKQNTVTIYMLDEAGYYTVPYKAMICSTGKATSKTPLGTFAISGWKRTWVHMLDDTYGQYVTQFNGNILFHSACYEKADPSTLITAEYNMLGEFASLGCVRLEAIDAKWIYDHCEAGTKVTVYDGDSPGPLGKPDRTISKIPADLENGWEPTDPRPENPWRALYAKGISISESAVDMELGAHYSLTWQLKPAGARLPDVKWETSDPGVVTVDSMGNLTAVGVGTATVTAACGNRYSSTCTVTVREGHLLDFEDVLLSAWYCEDVRNACEKGILKGTGPKTFSPDAPMNYAMAITVLYRLAGEPALNSEPVDGRWYSAALCWAREWGILDETMDSGSLPNAKLTNKELAELLYRYETVAAGAEKGSFTDYYKQLQGASAKYLKPETTATRAGAAAMLRSFLETDH